MRICIVRHGETDWNKLGKLQGREDIPLNETGVRQAERCGLALRKGKWGAVFSSPLSRARQTADIIAGITGIGEVYEDDDLIERDYGKASGLTAEERDALFPDGNYAGMEAWEPLKDRMAAATLRCAAKANGRDIILVSHGSAINSLLAHLSNHAIGTGKTPLQNGHLSMLEYTGGLYRILFYNKPADEAEI